MSGQLPIAVAVPAQLPSASTSSTPNTLLAIPAGTPVEIEIMEEISSASRQRGDAFPIRLAAPLVIDGVQRLPAGLAGVGQVVHAAGPRAGGGAGELLVAARWLRSDSHCIPLRGFSLGGSGKNAQGLAVGLGLALGLPGLLVRGRDIVIPAGTHGSARLRTEFDPVSSVVPTNPPTEKDSDPCAIV
jgi:hypothetical protein